jgi:hypothetical protein
MASAFLVLCSLLLSVLALLGAAAAWQQAHEGRFSPAPGTVICIAAQLLALGLAYTAGGM